MFRIKIIFLVLLAVVTGITIYGVKYAVAPKPLPTSIQALLTVINNQVQAKISPQEKFETVAANLKVEEGFQVKTLSTGRAIIEADNQTTTVIDKNSEITIAGQAKNQTKIQLTSGSLWARVKKVFGKDESYQVETPNAVATVRGTSFGVSYKDQQTTIVVTERLVSVVQLDPITKKPFGDEVIIAENQKATIVPGQKILIEPLKDSDKKSEWYQFNQKDILISTPSFSGEPTPTITLKSSLPILSPKLTSGEQNRGSSIPQGGIGTTTGLPNSSPSSVNPQSSPGSSGQGGVLPVTATPAVQTAKSEIYSVTPKTVDLAFGSKDFFINGKNLTGSKQVLLDSVVIRSYVLDPQTIIGTITEQVQPGIYNVSVVTATGTTLTLPQALTIK